jgi:hypothetical protein
LILPQNDAGILYFTSASAAIFYDYIQVGATSPLTTKGDLYTFGTSDTRLAVGTNGHTLVADSATATGLKWAAPAGGGKVLQVVSTTKTDTFSTSSTSFVDVTGLSVTITPSSATSKILVVASILSARDTNNNAAFKLLRGSTDIAIGDAAGSRRRVSAYSGMGDTYMILSSTITFLDSPSTTSSTTYKIQQTCLSAGNAYINRASLDSDATDFGRGASTITVMEIGA